MRRQGRKPRCEDCFFEQRGLCALRRKQPCPTFRPADRGLRPDPQLTFVFRFDWGSEQDDESVADAARPVPAWG